MSSPAPASYLPLVQYQLKQLAAIGAGVLLPFLLLVMVQQRRESQLQQRQEAHVRTLSAAQDAMLAIDELNASPAPEPAKLPGQSAWSASDCAALERISYRIDQVLRSGASTLAEDAQPVLARVRDLSTKLSIAEAPPASSPHTRSMVDVLRASLDQIRLMEQGDFENENKRFQETTHRVVLFAVPAMGALAGAGIIMAFVLIRSVGRQLRLEQEIRESLARSEERYRSLFDGSLDAIFSLGADGRFVTANPAALRLTGRTLEQLQAIHFLELCAPDQREAAANAFRAALCRQCLTLDTAMLTLGGERRELFISGAPTLLRNEIVGVACIARDVTERRQVDEVKNRERERLRRILDSQFGLVMVLSLDGIVTEINQAPLAAMRKTRDEVIGQRVWELNWAEPEATTQIQESVRRAAEGAVVRRDFAGLVPGLGRRDFDFVLSPLKDENGRVANVVAFGVDITERKQAEVALRESEMRLRTIFDSDPECLKLVNSDGAIVHVNPAGLRMLGVSSPDQIRGVNAIDLVDHAYRDAYRENIAAVFRGENTHQVFETVPVEGSSRWMEQLGAPIWDPAQPGKVKQMLSVTRDITEARQAEAKLHERDAILQKLSEQVPGVIYQFRQFADGRSSFPYASEGIRKIYEVSPEQVRETAEPVFQVLHPDDLDAIVASIQRSVETMEPWHAEYRVQLPSRGLRWVEGNSTPERMPDGSILWHGHIRDVTDRKQAETELRRLASIIEASRDFIGYSALDGQFLYLNSAGRTLVGLGKLSSTSDLSIRDFIPEADHDFLAKEIIPRMHQTGSWTGEFRLRHFGGREPIPVDINAFLIRDASGEPIAIANISRDIRERQRAERQANRSQRLEAIGTLAGGIAHDLNNALAPVLMATAVLKLRYPGEDMLLDTTESSCQRAADMVRQLLTFAKGASGQRVLIQPRQLLREMQKIVAGTFPKDIQLRAHYAPTLGMVLGDPTQLHQVLLNLCVNARDAMPHGGILSMAAEVKEIDALYASTMPDAEPGSYICLAVGDTGAGIPPEVVDRIFEPFFTTKGPDKGTGLGLSTVLGIVKGHGGFLRVYSEPGQGSMFQIYLPLVNDEGDDSEQFEPSTPAFSGHGETILIVDDESAILAVARTILERLGFKVITAENGAEGLDRAAQYGDRISIAITDLHMPRMDGLAFAKAMQPLCPHTKIIVSSGRLEESAAAEFEILGISAILHKPFTEKQLAETLRAILEIDDED